MSSPANTMCERAYSLNIVVKLEVIPVNERPVATYFAVPSCSAWSNANALVRSRNNV